MKITCLMWSCRNAIMGSWPRLKKPLLASTRNDRYQRVSVSGTGMVRNPAFSRARMYSLREVGFDGGQRSPEYSDGMPSPGQSTRYSRFWPALDFMFTTYNVLPSALTVTELGYHPVGIRPSSCWEATSMTATAFSPPSVA